MILVQQCQEAEYSRLDLQEVITLRETVPMMLLEPLETVQLLYRQQLPLEKPIEAQIELLLKELIITKHPLDKIRVQQEPVEKNNLGLLLTNF